MCDDAIDEDCDGLTDCLDPDCDFSLACFEDCSNLIDDNLTGEVDCADASCEGQSCGPSGLICMSGLCGCPGGATEVSCTNVQDDDCNGLIDCADPGCAVSASCTAPAVTAVDYGVIAHGGRLVITGTNFTGATAVTIGGIGSPFAVDSGTQITVGPVTDATPIGQQPLVVTVGAQSSAAFS